MEIHQRKNDGAFLDGWKRSDLHKGQDRTGEREKFTIISHPFFFNEFKLQVYDDKQQHFDQFMAKWLTIELLSSRGKNGQWDQPDYSRHHKPETQRPELLVVDKAQDMAAIYYRLLLKFIPDSQRPFQVLPL